MSKLKEIRKANNLPAKQVASYVGISPTTISMIENGYRNPSIQVAFKLADFFNVSIEELFPEIKEKTRKTFARV